MQRVNPFRPGAGHQPPYLAGRAEDHQRFRSLLEQDTILQNLVLTGLRGVGKTVLLESFKPIAAENGWVWAGADLTESASLADDRLATRLCTDLAPLTSSVTFVRRARTGFAVNEEVTRPLDYRALEGVYAGTPGLSVDKLKEVVGTAWRALSTGTRVRGIVFAYDEAQNLDDRSGSDEFPLSLLLDTFQSLQRQGLRVLLVLSGLPTLVNKLASARTYTERMFQIVELSRLSEMASRAAILRPIADADSIFLNEESVDTVVRLAGGYPYFIQFICREIYDVFIQRLDRGASAEVPVAEITRKLDADFFAGRWARATDRQRDLMTVASLVARDGEFTIQDLVEKSAATLDKPFTGSHANQMLNTLCERGMTFKNRRGRYAFALPLLADFIRRTTGDPAAATP
ncbi:MAG: ATP-binding protein [Gammaproteobacteria bacterium]|nr:ATP-binding protein [Gammaproteobacteria bacterium]MYF30127.1 ATP-binding protein [Gammaproteobacteria bacterium]MYK48016.1 ATP-binding protein [Gammaproteobacteria bacterium]